MRGSIKKVAQYLGWLFIVVLVGVLVFDFVKKGIFDNRTGINLLVVGDENMGILVIRPDSNLINWIPLPTDLKVKIYNTEANYPINSLWDFGVGERKPFVITEKSIGSMLGIIIPRAIKIDHVASVDNLLGKFLSLGLKTDLTIRDRWMIRKIISDAAISKKIFELEIPGSAFDKVTEADGKEFLVVNKIIDVWSKDKFYHDDILEEGSEISINNVSDVPGSGLQLSSQLDSSGFRVIDVVNDKNDDVKIKGCHFVAPDKFPLSKKYLVDQVGCFPLPKNEPKEVGDNLIKIWLK